MASKDLLEALYVIIREVEKVLRNKNVTNWICWFKTFRCTNSNKQVIFWINTWNNRLSRKQGQSCS